MSADVQLQDVWIRFGDFVAARDVNIHIKDGEFFSFLGPSGCGKTTLLRAVSGFLSPSQGEVLIGGNNMSGIGPNKRPTALIFQNLALFPLMTVWENIAFALEVKGMSKAARRKRADELLDLIALPGQGDKMVNELSGGQKQRVAIARALAAEPDVLLLDEPLSALDLKLRQHMRTELRAIQERVGITFIYITHDQGEALTMSDNVAVMSQGVIEQVAVRELKNGLAVVETPSGVLTARAISRHGEVQLAVGDDAYVFIRPESLRFSQQQELANIVSGVVERQEFEGNFWQVYLRVDGSERVVTLSMVNDGHSVGYEVGSRVHVGCNAELAIALPQGPMAAE